MARMFTNACRLSGQPEAHRGSVLSISDVAGKDGSEARTEPTTLESFTIEITRQGWIGPEPSHAKGDLCSHGDIRLVIGGCVIEPGDEEGEYTISTSALALLRTLESDHSPERPVAGKLVMHCGELLMLSCPIGIDWSVTHLPGAVRLSEVDRCDPMRPAARFPGLAVDLAEDEYRRQVVAFAEEAKRPFEGIEKVFYDDVDRQDYEKFWREYDARLRRAHWQLRIEDVPGEDRLRPLIDALDVDGTEERLQAALAAETTDAGRAEVLTQLARAQLFRGRLDVAQSLLDEADRLAGETGVARARVLLEGGRVVRRREGDRAALPLLERACEEAVDAGQPFIAADAAHVCALAGDRVSWTQRGLDIAERFEGAAYWKGTLLENLGEWQYDCGEYESSLASFEASLEAREQDGRNPELREYSRFGVARALRALGRPREAVPLLEQAVAWMSADGRDWPDGHLFREELTAARADMSR